MSNFAGVNNMKTVKFWIEAMRLRTLPVSVAGVVMAWALAVADGSFMLLPALLCLVFAILCQIASNFANEYYDYRAGRDRVGREGPRRGVTEGDISPKCMKYATYAVLLVAACVGLLLTYWGGLWLIAVGALIGVGALAYSTGPWPLSTHALGEVAVFVFFGLVPVSFTYYVQALTVTREVLLAGAAVGLMGANVLIVNNYRDMADDAAVGKMTLALLLGARSMPVLYVLNVIVAMACLWPVISALGGAWYALPVLFVAASVAIARQMTLRMGRSLTPLLGMTAVAMAALSILLLIGTVTC